MKKVNFLLILVTLNISLYSQAIVKGTIANSAKDTAFLYFHPTSLGTLGETLETTVALNGQFQFDINPLVAVPAVLEINDIQLLLFLFPDKSLQINIQKDVQNKVKIEFEGPAALDNQFYLNYRQEILKNTREVPPKLLTRFNPKGYLALQKKFKQTRLDYLNQSQNSIDSRLSTWLENNIVYQFANNLFTYPNQVHEPRDPNKSYYSFSENIILNNKSAILQSAYQAFIINFTRYKLEKTQKWGINTSAEEQFKFIRRYFVGDALYIYQFFLLNRGKFKKKKNREKEVKAFFASKAPEGYKQYIWETMNRN